jgi:hypothetical protein
VHDKSEKQAWKKWNTNNNGARRKKWQIMKRKEHVYIEGMKEEKKLLCKQPCSVAFSFKP